MKDYSAHQMTQFGLQTNLGILAKFIGNWHARRAVASLDRLDDFLLNDIGVTREDVRRAARTPLWKNAALVLNDVSRQRQLKYGRGLYNPESKPMPEPDARRRISHPVG